MSNYEKEIKLEGGKEVAIYTRPGTNFIFAIQPANMLDIYPGIRESTLDRYYHQWLNQQTNNKDE